MELHHSAVCKRETGVVCDGLKVREITIARHTIRVSITQLSQDLKREHAW